MTTKPRKLLEEIHPLSIIREVQKWPVLYAKDGPDRGSSTSHFKLKIWSEVAKALFDDWESYSEKEKEWKLTLLKKKWRNLCDTFKRQIQNEKKIRQGHNIKRKRYVYFKPMMYLLPHVNCSEETDPSVEPKLNEYFNKKARKKENKATTISEKSMKRKRQEVKLKSISKSMDTEEIDEDKHFLLSLVPSFKKMNEDEKLTAKVEILRVIKNVRSNSVIAGSSQEADSLSFNVEEVEVEEVKVESLQDEFDQTSQSESNESDFD